MSEIKSSRPRWLLLSILGLYLLLTIGYSLASPLFEAPDEHHHFYTAVFMAENKRLPIADLQEEWLRQEAAQPPLSYLLGALLIAPLDTSQATDLYWHNPRASIGDASALTNINWAIHTQTEAFPWQESALAAYLLRFLSTTFGLGTLLCIYGSGRLIWPQQPAIALLATAVTAFLPQFNFLHSAITNDTLIIFLGSLTLWQLLYLWQRGVTNGRLLLLGITIGLAILTKNAGTILLVYSLGIISLLWLKNSHAEAQRRKPVLSNVEVDTKKNLQSLISNLLWVFLPALLLGSWLWLRNWQLYGDPTAANMFVTFAGGDRNASILQVLREWEAMWPSLFAVFGWFNLRPPQWVYWLWNGIVVGALAGFLFALIKNKKRLKIETHLRLQSLIFNLQQPWFIALWLAGWVLAVYAGLILFMLRTEAAQGRLLFPAILPLALAVAYGWSRWRWPGIYFLIPFFALATSLVSLFGVIRPAYAQPPIINNLPTHVEPLSVNLGQGVQLLGAEIETQTAVPNAPVWLTLYWQTTTPLTDAPEITLEILGHELERVGQYQGYHGRGLYPASQWPTQQIVADRFAIRLEKDIATPVLANIYVGLVGEESRAEIGRIEIEPDVWPETDTSPLAKIGAGIELTAVTINPESAQPGDTINIAVQWRVTAQPGQDFTTLVHLVHPDEIGQPPRAAGDNQPRNGRYPTRLWEEGELIDDSYALVVPEGTENGRYLIWLGLYDPNTFARLPVVVDGQTDSVFPAGTVEIHD